MKGYFLPKPIRYARAWLRLAVRRVGARLRGKHLCTRLTAYRSFGDDPDWKRKTAERRRLARHARRQRSLRSLEDRGEKPDMREPGA